MRFIADHMLGSLARWLRFAGFDTLYPDVLPDKELRVLAGKEKRILLTRDMDLARAKDIESLYIESVYLEEQILQVMTDLKLKVDNPYSRCSLCNSLLKEVDKASVRDRVPERVYEGQNGFWKCEKCDKYYWHGTHFKGIKEKIDRLVRESSAA